MAELDGRVALVTGAGMGIGEACARALAREGASVLIAELDSEAGQRVEAAIRAADGEAATKAAIDAWGRLDILVNNAARAIGGVVDAIDEETWNEVMTTNLTSVWRF